MPSAPPGRRPARLIALILIAFALPWPASASGPAAPAGLEAVDWQALSRRGLRLDRDTVYNDGDGGLLATAVRLDGCDGALVGQYGLIVTSYQCARWVIAHGEVIAPVPPGGSFLAATWAEEIPLPGRRVTLLAAAGDGTPVSAAQVGLRLAWLPPPQVGAFGGDDEGPWPLRRGDFALLRAWTVDAGGEPTPYRPGRFLQAGIRGVRPGDPVLALGHGPDGAARVAVGSVMGYSPADAVWLEPQSTLRGQLELVTGQPPTSLPARVRTAATEIDPGRWSQAGLGSVPVGFLAATGPAPMSSGVPLVDGHGRLVGLALDLVSGPASRPGEGPEFRTVAADLRYLLWMLERVDGAWDLMRDLGVEPRAPRNPEPSPDVTTGEEP